jgi:hypothetical protein
MRQHTRYINTLEIREHYRDQYWQRRDPIYADRLLWRAQTFRHMVHLLPNQTILELGAGQGLFTQQLLRVSPGENPITRVTFKPNSPRPEDLAPSVEFLRASSIPQNRAPVGRLGACGNSGRYAAPHHKNTPPLSPRWRAPDRSGIKTCRGWYQEEWRGTL